MSIIQPGAAAPAFELDSHLEDGVALSKYSGKNILLVFYPLDFTPT
jgi:peroxiredoxin